MIHRRTSWFIFAAIAASFSTSAIGQVAPARSGDSSRIAAITKHGSENSLLVANAEGGSTYEVPKSVGVVKFSWSPNSRMLAFATNGAESGIGIYLHISGGATQLLSTGGAAPFAWREDSKRIAYFQTNRQGLVQLFHYNLAEKGVGFKVPIMVAPNPTMPMFWLPGTDDVAYVSVDGNVYLVESGEIHKITTTGDINGFCITPDLKHLVWARKSPNTKYILLSAYEFDLKERSVRRLPMPDQFPVLNPKPSMAVKSVDQVWFSPDLRQMALVVDFPPAGPKVTTGKSLVVTAVDGSGVVLITPFPKNCDAHWSPNGSLLFTSGAPTRSDINFSEWDHGKVFKRSIGTTKSR